MIRNAMLMAALAALAACGSGGGEDATRNGGGIHVQPSALTFTFIPGGATPDVQTVYVSWTAADGNYLIVYSDTARPTWLPIPVITASPGAGAVTFSVNTIGATLGTRSAVMKLGVSRTADLSGLIGSCDLPITFDVRSFAATPTAVASRWVRGSGGTPPSRSLEVSAQAATTFTATADQPWIQLSPASGTTPGGVLLDFAPAGLAIGTHAGTVTLTPASGAPVSVAVSFTIANATITGSPATVQLAGATGNDLTPKPVQVSLDTWTLAYPWTATTTADWLDLGINKSTASGISPGAFTVAPSAAAASWAPGSYDATIVLSALVDGTTVSTTVAVSYRLVADALAVSEEGVALASAPGLSLLSRNLTVSTTNGQSVRWTASSDQSWLHVPATGAPGDPLVLTANPAGLASDAIHEATVTVATDTAGVTGPRTVHVGLWHGAFAPEPVTSVAAWYSDLATDPVRPYVYLTLGGAGVDVKNVYTGAAATTITVSGATTKSPTVSADGRRLYVIDSTAHRVIPIDLATRTPGAGWPLPAGALTLRIAWARPHGVPVLVTGSGRILDPDTGAVLASFTPDTDDALAVSRDGSRLCTWSTGTSPYFIHCYSLDAAFGPSGPVVVLGPKQSKTSWSNFGASLALSPDGTRGYPAEWATTIATFDATLATMPNAPLVLRATSGTPSFQAVAVGPDGRIVAGGSSDTPLWAWSAGGTALGSWSVGPVMPRRLAVSGDGVRAVAIIGSGYTPSRLAFVTVGP